ncbi:hypothetical protein TSUD_53420 [Trifolium subterraneum]|uniref:Transposase-associated domain-containing protein n=1 Tax=Trifolium subterraneum TaxID=3900 RepID=A0A2Z6MHN8_TRISU|nr:hypothetical protein TSUD_53420 [Trifolium subterraneum]
MYDMKYPGRRTLKARFKHGVREFVTYVMSRDVVKREGGIRCPCLKCSCVSIIKSPEDVIDHLENVGFMDDYYVWRHHGEQEPQNINVEFMVETHASSSGVRAECENFGHMEDMVGDALGVNLSYERGGEEEIIPNEKALKFYSMMEEVNKPLFEGSSDSKVSMCVRLLAARSNWNVPEDCLEFFSEMMLDATPVKDNLPKSYYDAKRLVSKLGLEVKKIDCCVQGCMLFYDNEFGTNDGALEECKFCNAPRYQVCISDVHRTQKRVAVKLMFYLPIIPRLQRLFASMQTASQMASHYYNKTNSNVMRHPCDGLAWKHFDAMHRDFAEDPRNVRLGLCFDGFSPYIQASASPYSCWPVIVTPYNLPPEMCMIKSYMFLSCIIPGPSNPTDGIDIYLQPLIDDLKRLWIGELTYDIARKENFTMRAALMWTINDFPAYGMLSGWSTHGKLACPHCMKHTKAFYLKEGGKTSWFDCHRRFLPENHQFRRKKNLFKLNTTETDGPPPKITSYEVFDRVSGLQRFLDVGKRTRYVGYGESHNWTKRSIFWDLPYWKDNLLRHNLDVMHIEKNFCDNILHTVMNVSGKTKDNEKARLDLPLHCNRPEMELQQLRMPDGYSSNLARGADVNKGRLRGMKSHDSHVLMERLLPIAFCSLPNNVLNPLTESNSSRMIGTFDQQHQQQQQQHQQQQQQQQSTPESTLKSSPEEQRQVVRRSRGRISEDTILVVGKRPVIYPHGHSLEQSKQSAKMITKVIKLMFEDAFYPTYKELYKDNDAKEKIELEFLERQLGRKPFINEVHKTTHIIQGTGDYVDVRSRVTQAKYDDLVLKYIERHPEYSCNADLPEAVQLHLWDLASGPGNDYIPTGEEQYSHPTTIPPELQKTIETMVQQLESQTVELQRRAQREQELTERLNKDIEDRRQRQQSIEKYFSSGDYRNKPPPPAPHHGEPSHVNNAPTEPSDVESESESEGESQEDHGE